MQLVILLIIAQVIMLVTALTITKFNIGLPSNIMMIFLFIGFVFYAFGYNTWNNSLKSNTALVIIFGFFIIWICSILFSSKVNKVFSTNTITFCNYKNESNIAFLFIVAAVFLIFYILGILLVGRNNGLPLSRAISYVKDTNGEGVPILFRQGFKVVTVCSYVSCFLYLNNKNFNYYAKRTNIKLILMIIFGILITILSSSRGDLLKILSAFICCYFLTNKINNKSNTKMLKKLTIYGVLILAVFYISRSIVKTFGNESTGSLDFFDYLNYYLGSPFEVLNIKLQNLESYRTYYYGQNTFGGIYDILSNLGLIFSTDAVGPEFVYLGNYNFGGNVATFYFTFISDFGYGGYLFCVLCFALLGNVIYINLRIKQKPLRIIFFSMLYSFFTFSFYGGILYYLTNTTALYTYIVLILIYIISFKISFNSNNYRYRNINYRLINKETN